MALEALYLTAAGLVIVSTPLVHLDRSQWSSRLNQTKNAPNKKFQAYVHTEKVKGQQLLLKKYNFGRRASNITLLPYPPG